MREDDSCAPHSPHTMSIQQVRPFGLGGFGVSSFSQFNLEQFREEFYLFFKKKKCVIWGEEAFQLFNLFPNLPFTPFLPSPVLESTESVR